MTTQQQHSSPSPFCYLPCKEFPNEIENYFCLQCREPASALSFLVGSHFNHPRRPLMDDLHQYPVEIWSSEVSEFRSVSNQLVESATDEWDQCKYDRESAVDRIQKIDDEVRRLQEERRKLVDEIEESDDKQEEIRFNAVRQFHELSTIANEALIPKMKTGLREVFRANHQQQREQQEQQEQKFIHNFKATQMTLNVLADEMKDCLKKCGEELSTALGIPSSSLFGRVTSSDSFPPKKSGNHFGSLFEDDSSASPAIKKPTSNKKSSKRDCFDDDSEEEEDEIDPEIAILIRDTLSRSPLRDDNGNVSRRQQQTIGAGGDVSVSTASTASSDSSYSYYSDSRKRKITSKKQDDSRVSVELMQQKQHPSPKSKVKLTLEQLKTLISQGFSSSSSSYSSASNSFTSTSVSPGTRQKETTRKSSTSSRSRRKERELEREQQMRASTQTFTQKEEVLP